MSNFVENLELDPSLWSNLPIELQREIIFLARRKPTTWYDLPLERRQYIIFLSLTWSDDNPWERCYILYFLMARTSDTQRYAGWGPDGWPVWSATPEDWARARDFWSHRR